MGKNKKFCEVCLTETNTVSQKEIDNSKEGSKVRKSDVNSAITNFLKREKKLPLLELKLAVKKFFEIQSEIKNAPKNIEKYSEATLQY